MSDPMIEGFEASLRDNPEDLAGWNAYADYLTEQGDPRGEFMAVQLALEREGLSRQERARLKKRETALQKNQDRWLGADLAEAIRETKPEYGDSVTLEYRRGWLQGLTLDLGEYFTNRAPQDRLLEAIAVAPEARWVLSLTIHPPDRTHIELLGTATFLSALRRLHIGGDEENSYADRCSGEEAIFANAPRLESVVLCMKEPPDHALFTSHLPNLREIVVGCAWSFATEQLAANASFRNLRTLRLVPGCVHGDSEPQGRLNLADLELIAGSPHLVSLAELRFSLSDAGDAGIDVLIRSGLLSRLESLDLSHGSVTDAGAESLASELGVRPHRLRVLNLKNNALTDAGVARLRALGLVLHAEEQHEPGSLDYLFENGNME